MFSADHGVSGFGPYNCLWLIDAPTECAGVTPTPCHGPWAMMPTMGYVSYHWGRELLVPLPQDVFVGFF